MTNGPDYYFDEAKCDWWKQLHNDPIVRGCYESARDNRLSRAEFWEMLARSMMNAKDAAEKSLLEHMVIQK